MLVVVIFAIIANWKMYKKAGKNGWECIVPFYGHWVLTKIAGLEWWWFLLAIASSVTSVLNLYNLDDIASLVSFFATFNIYYNVAKKFGKETGNAILAGIFSGIFVFIFGFSNKEVYNSNIPVSKNGVFGKPEDNFTNNSQTTQNNDMNNLNQGSVFCRHCGTKLNKDVRFCHHCGKENI
jgi:hypothetical protein